VNKNLKTWDLLLAYAQSAYNKAPNGTTNESPFQVMYGHNPLDLLPIHLNKMDAEAGKIVKEIQELHKRVQDQIKKANERYQNQANKNRKPAIFKPGDLVWVHLRKERFPSKR